LGKERVVTENYTGVSGDVKIGAGIPAAASRLDVSGHHAVALASLFIDGFLIVCLSILAGAAYSWVELGHAGDLWTHISTGLLVAVVFCGEARLLGATQPLVVSRASGRARIAIISWVSTFLFLAFIAFSLRIGAVFSRGAVLSFFAAGLPLVVLSRVFTPRFLAKRLDANSSRGGEVIVASPYENPALKEISSDLRERGNTGIHVIQFDGNCDTIQWPTERKKLLQQLLDRARIAGPGDIYVLTGQMPQERVASILAGLRIVPRTIYLVPDDAFTSLLSCTVSPLGKTVAVEIKKAPRSPAQHAVKRSMDIAVASAGLLFIAPLLLAIALCVKLDSDGPVFFRQRRNGYRGREFYIYKFRSMTVLEDGDNVEQARLGDKRVTRVGQWLRKTSLDELPQLLNVLRGEMSLVGPRPHAIAHDKLYTKLIEHYELRQHVKPGITGWAQVNGFRGETPNVDLMYRRIEFDLWYAGNSSLALDLEILLRTPFVIWKQQNAY
jgi:Undecaprenyl-phosphate glucose phosphotransferase